jgi:hypothetical protein
LSCFWERQCHRHFADRRRPRRCYRHCLQQLVRWLAWRHVRRAHQRSVCGRSILQPYQHLPGSNTRDGNLCRKRRREQSRWSLRESSAARTALCQPRRCMAHELPSTLLGSFLPILPRLELQRDWQSMLWLESYMHGTTSEKCNVRLWSHGARAHGSAFACP